MSLADALERVILARGPLPATELAPAVRRRRKDVLKVLHGDSRFHRSGKRKACRWGLEPVPRSFDVAEARWPEGFEEAEEALVRLVSQGRSCPEEALLRIVAAWSRSELLEVAA